MTFTSNINPFRSYDDTIKVEFEMSEEGQKEYDEAIEKFEARQKENNFLKRIKTFAFDENIPDADFRKWVQNYLSAGGLD